MITGESITIIRSKGYIITSIKPCTMEKGKKMAKIRLTKPPKDILKRLERAGLGTVHTDLGVARFTMKGKHVMVFESGEISIRAADDDADVLKTAEELADLLLK